MTESPTPPHPKAPLLFRISALAFLLAAVGFMFADRMTLGLPFLSLAIVFFVISMTVGRTPPKSSEAEPPAE